MSLYEVGHWINGGSSRGTGERRQDIHNPATGGVQGTLLLGSVADLDAAVASATQAVKAWSQTPPSTGSGPKASPTAISPRPR